MSHEKELEELRDRLRSGDPAEGTSLGPQESARMRRAMLSAVPEPPGHSRALRWALTAVAVAAVGSAILWWQVGHPEGSRQASPAADERMASQEVRAEVDETAGGHQVPAPRVSPRRDTVAAAVAAPEDAAEVAHDESDVGGEVSEGRDPRPHAPITEDREPASETTRPRQLRLVAPGGTQIVWVLDPHFDLGTTPETRSERSPT